MPRGRDGTFGSYMMIREVSNRKIVFGNGPEIRMGRAKRTPGGGMAQAVRTVSAQVQSRGTITFSRWP
jgi:hypothetical protein